MVLFYLFKGKFRTDKGHRPQEAGMHRLQDGIAVGAVDDGVKLRFKRDGIAGALQTEVGNGGSSPGRARPIAFRRSDRWSAACPQSL